jgi:hypothetical protein
MKIGEQVRVIGIPEVLPDDDMGTRALFELCLARTFPIVGHQGRLLELEVGYRVKEQTVDVVRSYHAALNRT